MEMVRIMFVYCDGHFGLYYGSCSNWWQYYVWSNVCEGKTETYSVNAINGACEAEWEITNGNLISQTSTSVCCAMASNRKKLKYAYMLKILATKKFLLWRDHWERIRKYYRDFYTCPNQSYNYKGNEYFKGDHEIRLKNFTGCDSVLKLTIERISLATKNLDTFFVKMSVLWYLGRHFVLQEIFCWTRQNNAFPFCDSIVYINIKRTWMISAYQI